MPRTIAAQIDKETFNLRILNVKNSLNVDSSPLKSRSNWKSTSLAFVGFCLIPNSPQTSSPFSAVRLLSNDTCLCILGAARKSK